MKDYTLDDIDGSITPKIYAQNYSQKEIIEGVRILPLHNHVGEEGDFSEIIRLNQNDVLEELPFFHIVQINRTKLHPKSIKAWHLHFKQNEIWYVSPSDHLLVGLWDIRKESKTNLKIMRIVLGGGSSQLLFIPRGVAHGSSNLTEKSVELFYFVDKHFTQHDPDEKRIHWDVLGVDFWLPQKD